MDNPSHKIEISIPYHMKPEHLVVDPAAKDADWKHELLWLSRNAEEEEVPRILRGTLALYVHNMGHLPIGDCLHTAIIWERG